MLGALVGDVIGSAFEQHPIKKTTFPLFSNLSTYTDDSVLTVAIADCLLQQGDYQTFVLSYAREYPDAGYGGKFKEWMTSENPQPYQSWGNGGAMRVAPIGYAFDDLEHVLLEAERSAAITHDHPEGIRGAQAIATAVFLARQQVPKEEIRQTLMTQFDYDLTPTIRKLRPAYAFGVSSQGSVPAAIIAFLDSEDFETAVRLAISLGGDSDTLASMAGAMAEAFYQGVPPGLAAATLRLLPFDFRRVLTHFRERFGLPC